MGQLTSLSFVGLVDLLQLGREHPTRWAPVSREVEDQNFGSLTDGCDLTSGGIQQLRGRQELVDDKLDWRGHLEGLDQKLG